MKPEQVFSLRNQLLDFYSQLINLPSEETPFDQGIWEGDYLVITIFENKELKAYLFNDPDGYHSLINDEFFKDLLLLSLSPLKENESIPDYIQRNFIPALIYWI